jgi:anti-sigma B factor antagonist
MELQVRGPLRDGVALVAASGEIDLSTAPQLEQFLLDAIPPQRVPPPGLVLDLSGVEFFGAAGIAVLLRLQDSLEHLGGRLRLCNVSPIVTRVLTVTDLQDRFCDISYPASGPAGVTLPP